MKKIVTLLILAFVVVNAVTTEQEILAEVSQSNEFGAAITSLIQMQSATAVPTGRLNAINDLLLSLKAQIVQQTVTERERIERTRIDCNTTIDDLASRISNTRNTITDEADEIASLESQMTEQRSILSEKRSSLSEDESSLAEYRTQLEQGQTNWASFQTNFEEAIRLCETALNLLRQMVAGHTSSFAQDGGIMLVQLSQKFENIKSMLEESAKDSQTAFIEPIIDVLVQLGQSSHVDTAQVQQIIELIQRLIARLRQGLDARQANYNNQVNSLTQLIDQLQTQVRTQSAFITTIEETIQSNEDTTNGKTEMLQQLQDVLVALEGDKSEKITECQEDETSYRELSVRFETQVAVLDRLIQHFQSQVNTSVTNISDNVYEDQAL